MRKRNRKHTTESYDLVALDPHLPPDWRRVDAQRLARGERTNWSSTDAAVVEYASYLKAMARASSPQQAAAVRERWPVLAAAAEIADQDSPLRQEVAARLLAGQTSAEIATKCNMPAAVVDCYESVFCNVRPRLHADKWIVNCVVGPGLHCGFADHEVRSLWTAFAYFGGPIVLDAFLAAFYASWRPGQPVTLSTYLRPNANVDPKIQANVAVLVLSPFGPAGKPLMACHLRFLEADAASQDRRAEMLLQIRSYVIACGRHHLAGQPFPQPPWRRRGRCKATRETDEVSPNTPATDKSLPTVADTRSEETH